MARFSAAPAGPWSVSKIDHLSEGKMTDASLQDRVNLPYRDAKFARRPRRSSFAADCAESKDKKVDPVRVRQFDRFDTVRTSRFGFHFALHGSPHG
jgi:hypothetical protein